MSQQEKRLKRLAQKPRDYTWDELTALLSSLGYQVLGSGKTGGSRRRFSHPDHGDITFHQPHPGNLLKRYQVEQIVDFLKQEGFLP